MSKHTPGPWTVLPEECDKPYIRVRGTTLGVRYKIANVITPVYEGVPAREAIETRANARLIAAAPKLLEVLKALCTHAPRSSQQIDADWDKARAAIAKAEGEGK